MAIISLVNYLGNSASYDNVSGELTLQMGANKIAEVVVADLLLEVYNKAEAKRTDLNFPFARKAFETIPNASIILRSDEATTPTTELQIEFDMNLSLFFRYDQSLVISNIVRTGD